MFIENKLLIECEIESLIKRRRQKSYSSHVVITKIGRKLWFSRHCGVRMLLVKVFYENKENPRGKSIRGTDEYVCPKCYYHFTARSDFG